MAEEHRCQAPQLCVNNCGFFGSPTTQNLRSKCYRDLQHKEQHTLAFNQTLISSSSAYPSSSSSPSFSSPLISVSSSYDYQVEHVADMKKEEEEEKDAAAPSVDQKSRCMTMTMTCRRRVGLTGFKCRCGMTLCGTHRYLEKHKCQFNFKTMGKEQITKANPVVKGEKLQKI